MKKLLYILMILTTLNVFSQVPEKINYQMTVRNFNNTLVANSNIGISIKIVAGPGSGFLYYTETHNVTTNAYGLVNIQIGDGTTTLVANNFNILNWDLIDYRVRIALDLSGGTNYTNYGTVELVSVPYAFAANDVINKQQLTMIGDTIFLSGGGNVVIPSGNGANTLEQAYNEGGAGVGREITANDGAVKISGEDGLLVTGVKGQGADVEVSGEGTRMFFNPNKGAFRVGTVTDINNTVYDESTYWDNDSIGLNSFAAGIAVKAKGHYSVAMGVRSEATGSGSVALGWGNHANGGGSVAMGLATVAKAESSTAFGGQTQANAPHSFAAGGYTEANGAASTAFGGSAKANGVYSTAIGNNTIANGYATTAIGYYNDSLISIETSISNITPLFIVGNGDSIQRSNAMVLRNDGSLEINEEYTFPTTDGSASQVLTTDGVGNVSWGNASGTGSGANTLDQAYDQGGAGIGREIIANDGAVKISGEDGLSVLGTFGLGADFEYPNGNSIMRFNPKKSSLNVGFMYPLDFDIDSIGDYSLQTGYRTLAIGEASAAFGTVTRARGASSASFGYGTEANGYYSFSTGNATQANGNNSTSMGYYTNAIGDYSTSIGYLTTSIGIHSIAMGSASIANADQSTAIGMSSIANGFASTVIGLYNDTLEGIESLNSNTPLFIIGNGASGFRSNAFAVRRDGRVEINDEYTFPTIDGSASQVLSTDGAGNVSWATVSGGGINTDDQNLTLSNDTLYIEDGNYVYLPCCAADQNISLLGDSLSITDGNTIDISSINTDNQTLTLSGNNLSIAGGNMVDLSGLSGGTGANTLDQAYDQGGNGAGRVIIANNGAVRISGNDGLLVTGTGFGANVEISGTGTRMFFNPKKAAFRTGKVQGVGANNWDNDSIGTYSFAAGYSPLAKGSYSVSMGYETKATSNTSVALGYQTEATGYYTTALGYKSKATAQNATAIGDYSEATDNSSVAIGNHAKATSNNAFAAGYYSEANGNESIAMGAYSEANGYRGTAIGSQNEANGSQSTALGFEAEANGYGSAVLGHNSTANGTSSVALGHNTAANGNQSTSLGFNTKANSIFSVAMGNGTQANGYASTAIGYYNDTIVSVQTVGSTNNPIFTIGNGNSPLSLSNAFTVYDDGSVEINENYILPKIDGIAGQVISTDGNGDLYWTNNSSGGGSNQTLTLVGDDLSISGGNTIDLSSVGSGSSSNTLDQSYDQGGNGNGREIIATDGSVKITGTDGLLVTGTYGLGLDVETSSSSSKMFFNPKKAAFRVGHIYDNTFTTTMDESTFWDNDSIGDYSFAAGENCKSSATGSVSFGFECQSNGTNAFSMGSRSNANGNRSLAIGTETNAEGLSAVALGYKTDAIGDYSTALGYQTDALGDYSNALGYYSSADGGFSTAFGANTIAYGNFSTALNNYTSAYGHNSTAMGYKTITNGSSSLVIGMWNDPIVNTPDTLSEETPLFIIGNGDGPSRKNALVVKKSGHTVINGDVDIDQSLSFGNNSIVIFNDSTVIDVSNKSFLKLDSDAAGPSRRVILSDGRSIGQILYIVGSNSGTDGVQFTDGASSVYNLELNATRDLQDSDVLQLIWNGTNWLEVSFSDN